MMKLNYTRQELLCQSPSNLPSNFTLWLWKERCLNSAQAQASTHHIKVFLVNLYTDSLRPLNPMNRKRNPTRKEGRGKKKKEVSRSHFHTCEWCGILFYFCQKNTLKKIFLIMGDRTCSIKKPPQCQSGLLTT